MTTENPSTPEKQLLKLIEESPHHRSSTHKVVAKRKSLGLFSISAWISRITFLQGRLRSWFGHKGTHQPDFIRIINRVLFFSIFILVGYFILNLKISLGSFKKIPQLQTNVEDGIKAEGFKEASILKAASYYLEKIRQRNIFKMGPLIVSDERGKKGPSSRLLEATQHFRLVGISWSGDPDAMIEDAEKKRTFFVKRGQMIGSFKVRAILKDRVILSLGNEEIELK